MQARRLSLWALALGVSACSSAGTKSRDSADAGDSEPAETSEGGTLSVDRTVLDFGARAVGVTATEVLAIENTGDADLTIEALTLGGGAPFALSAVDDLVDTVLPPGSAVDLVVSYTPDDEVADVDTLSLQTDQGTSTVTVQGTGIDDPPLARVVCPPSFTFPGVADLDGTASVAGGGAALMGYAWSVASAPTGSAASIVNDGQALAGLVLDLPGTYTVSLEVENDLGAVSAPATCAFEALPEADVFVSVHWDTNDSDIDLHVSEADAQPFELPGDCTYCNPSPDWGETGDAGDPVVLVDSRTGYGPEVILIDGGADGEYTVWVHYFDDKGGGRSTATVTLWTERAMLWEGSAALDGRDMWEVGTLSWSTGTFTESGAAPERWTGPTACYEPE